MTFCKNCGAQLEGNEKFCVKCGAPVDANGPATQPNGPGVAAAAPVAAVQAAVAPMMAAAVPARPPAMVQPPPAAGLYASFGATPVAVPLPQAAPMKHSWATTVIVLVVLAAGGYYYQKYQAAPVAPQPGTAPAQPAQAPQPAPPATAPSQPGAAPPVPGGGQGPAQQQVFAGHWQVTNGYVVISNGTWKNNANSAMQSAVLECDQFNAGRADLAQMKMTLNGPVQPGGAATFNPFQMGGAVMNMQTVNCGIVDVTPAN
jgi:hypothetical protein